MDDDLWYTEPRKLLEGAYFPSPEGPYNPDTGCTGWAASFGISVKAQAAIILRIPESGDPDLDAMIRKAQRRDLAAIAMQGILANPAWDGVSFANSAAEAVRASDALLAALAQPKQGKEGGEG